MKFDAEQRAAIDKTPYPFNIRQEMGITLYNMMQNYPGDGKWKVGLTGIALMLNSASHDNGRRALEMVIEDIVGAHRRDTPAELVRFAIDQVVSWREIMLETQPRVERTIGSITKPELKKELQGKLPDEFITQILP